MTNSASASTTADQLCFSSLHQTMSMNSITLRLSEMEQLRQQISSIRQQDVMCVELAPLLAVQDRTLGVVVQLLSACVTRGHFAQAAALLQELRAPSETHHAPQQWASLFPALGSSTAGTEAALAAAAATGDMDLAGQLLAVAAAFDLQITQHMAQSLIVCAHKAGAFSAAAAVASLALRLPSPEASAPPLLAFVSTPLATGDTRAALSAFKVASLLQHEAVHGEMPPGHAVELHLPPAETAQSPADASPQAASYAQYLSQLHGGGAFTSSTSDDDVFSALPSTTPASAGAAGLLACFPPQREAVSAAAEADGAQSAGEDGEHELQMLPTHSLAQESFHPARYLSVGEAFPGAEAALAGIVSCAAANGGTGTEALCDAAAEWAAAHGFSRDAGLVAALLGGYASKGLWGKAHALVQQVCSDTHDEQQVPYAIEAYLGALQQQGAWEQAAQLADASAECGWGQSLRGLLLQAATGHVEEWAAGQEADSTAVALAQSHKRIGEFIQAAWRSHATPGAIATAEERGWAHRLDEVGGAARTQQRSERQTEALAGVARAHACASFNAEYTDLSAAAAAGSTVASLTLATRLALQEGDVPAMQRLLQLCAQNGWSAVAAKLSRAVGGMLPGSAHEVIVARLQCLTASVGGLARLLLAVHDVQEVSGSVPASMRGTLQAEAQMHIETTRRCPRTSEPAAAAATARFLTLTAGRLHRGAMSVLQADSTHSMLSKAEAKAGVRWSPLNVEHTLRLRAPDVPGGALLAAAGMALQMRDMDTATALAQHAPTGEAQSSDGATFRMLVQLQRGVAAELAQQVVAGAVFSAAVRATEANEPLPAAVLAVDLDEIRLDNARELCRGAVLYSCVQQEDWRAAVEVLKRSSAASSDAAQAVLAACDDSNLSVCASLRAAQLVQWHYPGDARVRGLLLRHAAAWLAEEAAELRSATDEDAPVHSGGDTVERLVQEMFPAALPLSAALAEVADRQAAAPTPEVRSALCLVSAACGARGAMGSDARSTAEQVCSAATEVACDAEDLASAAAVAGALREMGLRPVAAVAGRVAPALQSAGHYDIARWMASAHSPAAAVPALRPPAASGSGGVQTQQQALSEQQAGHTLHAEAR